MADANQDLIVYVDQTGSPTGETAKKLDAHTAHTKRHLAFSCYIFDDQGRLLVTQRAHGKKVWPGVWTNSVCGHPSPGEELPAAVVRRAAYELGMKLKDIVVVLPNYSYKTPPYNGIIENEFCPVYVARAATDVQPNPEEVEAYRWMSWAEFVQEALGKNSEDWSYWCKDQLKSLQDKPQVKAML